MDADALNSWMDDARGRLAASGRAKIGDQRIGHALWYAPIGSDEFHPAEAVRDVFERVASQDLDIGYEIEARNSRGVVWRGSGGDQERELADRYGQLATVFQQKWPRMAVIYRSLDDAYKSMARHWDEREALD